MFEKELITFNKQKAMNSHNCVYIYSSDFLQKLERVRF